MPKSQLNHPSPVGLHLSKYFVSAFVVFGFAAYTLFERHASSNTAVPTVVSPLSQANALQLPTPTVATNVLRDGTYTGDVADAFYGNVQVQATIQSGKITDVRFLDYPHDRRTSQEINSQATPWLQSEAVQAQSANVNLISGATLTSQAFVQSLQSALNQAHS